MKCKKLITASDCGYDGKLALESVLNIIQDQITVTFGEIGCDNVTLREKYHSMWVFTKHKAKVSRCPDWNEVLDVNCRIVKANRLVCYCKTDFTDSNGNIIIESILECCVIDVESFKFVKLSDIPFCMQEEECDTSFVFDNVEMDKKTDFIVMPILCDFSNHLNNAKAMYPLVEILTKNELDEQ